MLSCHPGDMSPNVAFSEVFVFEMLAAGSNVLAKLPFSWRVTGVKISNRQLAVVFLEGSGACPEWIVTSNLRWNGSRFVSTGQSRKKNSCAR